MDINKIDKIDTNLVVPSIQDNLMEIERDKWGNILNEQTFKTLNNNMKIMKEILLEIANESNLTNLDSIKLRLNNLETDRDSIESIVDNNTNGLINVGITERKLNLKGTELEFNGNKVDLDNIVYSNDLTNVAYTNRENTFSENINNTKVYKLKGGTVLENVDNKIKVGNISNKLDLQTTDGTFLVNGEEFRLPTGEDDYGLINYKTIKQVSPKPDLSPYIKHEEKINWMGTDGYGGLLQDAGTKKVGIAYYDKANKQMVVPTVENNLTYFEGSKFIPISDYQNAKKLENLYKVSEIVEVPNPVFSAVKFWRYGNRAFLFVFFDHVFSTGVNWMTEGITLTNYPANFNPDTSFLNTEHAIIGSNNLNKNIARLVLRNDKITIHGVEGMTHYELKGIISYMTK